MSVEKAYIKYPIYSTDGDNRTLEMYNKVNGVEFKTDITATFSDVVMEIRAGENPKSELIKRLSLEEGTMTVTDTNVLNFDIGLDVEAGVYYYDIRYLQIGDTKYQTYIKGVAVVENNISRT